jgi:hypothetical protein
MRSSLLCVFAAAASSVVLYGCSDVESPGVPGSALDAPIDLKHPLTVGLNRIEQAGVRGSIAVKPLAHASALPWFDDGYSDEISTFTSEVSEIHLTVDGVSIILPRESISLLVDPHWWKIERAGTRVYLVLDGLDGAASYRTIFTVENGSLRERLVSEAEFSHQTWERTAYHDDFILHPEHYRNM